MTVYYSENNPYAAQWLRNLIGAGHIAAGDVDERDIRDVQPSELAPYIQCHFFAGIGGWAYAARIAGWPADRELWTGSCPCQPFSIAGSKSGVRDERHLWPAFHRLITERRPSVVVGEQVASKDGHLWLAGIRTNLEEARYAVWAADLCAAGVSAPHIRQRLYWMGVTDCAGSPSRDQATAPVGYGHSIDAAGGDDPTRLVNANGYHRQWWSGPVQVGRNGCEAEIERGGRKYRAQWRLEPGIPIVAHGVPARVGQLCAAGNAIVPQVGAEFLRAYLDHAMISI